MSADLEALQNQRRAPAMLKVVEINQYGNFGYAVHPDGKICAMDLDPKAVWTIREPDESWSFPHGEIRTYDNVRYLLSPRASQVLPQDKPPDAAVTVISVEINGEAYFLLTGDNKPFLMNCGGASDPGESFRQAAVREVNEELGIQLNKRQLQTIAKWTHEYENALIGPVAWTAMTVAFHVQLQQDQVQHLIPVDHVWANINVFRPGIFSETELVVFIRKGVLGVSPNRIQGKKFDAHHRRILYVLENIPMDKDCDTNYLSSFTWLPVSRRRRNPQSKDCD